jgi:Zn-finger nucleic acid-binding protein
MSLKKQFLARAIDCPRCNTILDRKEIEIFGPNIFIDICPKCGGIWLDDGELKKLLKHKKLSDHLTKEIGIKSTSKLICPRCGGLMDIEHADDIDVDVCLTCNGVWLDKGELQELKAKSEGGFEGDDLDKAEEKWEEINKKNRDSRFNRFLRKLGR